MLDSGATYHVFPRREWFSSFEKIDSGVVIMRNDHSCQVEGVGTVWIKMCDGVVRVDGTYVPITDYWFEFRTMEHGVQGYFDFTSIPTYKNLKGVSNPEHYLINIKADGYASSKDYVQNNYYDELYYWYHNCFLE